MLLAEPFMMDPHFKRAAVLLCEHTEDGSLGFILNKPINMKVDRLVNDFPEFNARVYYGGPVATDTLHYVHDKGDILDDSIEISPGIFWGGHFDKLKFLVASKLILEDNIRFFVGYSGWSAGQLNEEMQYGSWVMADVHPNYVFQSATKTLWKQIMEDQGDALSVIAQMPDDISPN
jgi:putative transcriptional regulator